MSKPVNSWPRIGWCSKVFVELVEAMSNSPVFTWRYFRHVLLVKPNKTHIAYWRTLVTTPKITKAQAIIEITTELVGDKKHVEILHEIFKVQNKLLK